MIPTGPESPTTQPRACNGLNAYGWNMSRWKTLPTSLDEQAQKLVIQLRWLKDRSGLSLLSHQSKTGYSRSSWERYLNGTALLPREAVEAFLARVSGVDATKIVVVHEMAAEAWLPSPAPVAGAAVGPTVSEPRVLIGVGTAVVVGALLAGLLVIAPWEDGCASGESPKGSGNAPSSAAAFIYHPGKTCPCPLEPHKGQLYAGHSTARTRCSGRVRRAGTSWRCSACCSTTGLMPAARTGSTARTPREPSSSCRRRPACTPMVWWESTRGRSCGSDRLHATGL